MKEAAVVALADEKWGEVPCAFVETDEDPSQEEIVSVLPHLTRHTWMHSHS